MSLDIRDIETERILYNAYDFQAVNQGCFCIEHSYGVACFYSTELLCIVGVVIPLTYCNNVNMRFTSDIQWISDR
jgi:hypothetical protein